MNILKFVYTDLKILPAKRDTLLRSECLLMKSHDMIGDIEAGIHLTDFNLLVSIVLRGRESRLHELILNGEGIDSGMQLSTGTINRTVGSEK